MSTTTATIHQRASEQALSCDASGDSAASRLAMLAYGAFCYAIFLGVFLYAIGFVVGFGAPITLDATPGGPIVPSLAMNVGLLGLFAVQHSVMARPSFKRRWTRVVPEAAERSTYVLFSSAALALLFALWQPIGGVVWSVESTFASAALYGLGAAGWLLVLLATFAINHFDLFGLRQVWLAFRQREYTPLRFKTPGMYSVVRHPLYVGWLFAFWCTPRMTVAHLVFAIATTLYILVAIQLEERNLVEEHGEAYRDYRRRVPMLVPFSKRKSVVEAS
jgi:protein-S-isoprenylcysteine O-methyltransferase Ste14